MEGRTDGWTDGRTNRHLEIHPCVLQDIAPSGPPPKKEEDEGKTEVMEEKKAEKTA